MMILTQSTKYIIFKHVRAILANHKLINADLMQVLIGAVSAIP